MKLTPGTLAVAVAVAAAVPALADGDCSPQRPLTAAEQQWLERQLAAVEQALPAPADWLRFDRHELEGGEESVVSRPASICTGVAPYALQIGAEVQYAPRGSALARRVEIARRLKVLRAENARLDGRAEAGQPGMAAAAMDSMRLQQEMLAALQRGDGAAVERLGRQMEQAGARHTAAVEDARREGESDLQSRHNLLAEQQRLEQEDLALAEPARAASRVSMAIAVNSTGGAARDKSGARELKVSGAKFAWLNTGRGCGDGAPAAAYALIGDYRLDPWDAGDARIFELAGPVKSHAEWHGTAVTVCGAPADAERFLGLLRGEALRR